LKGVDVASIMIDAGATSSPVLLQVEVRPQRTLATTA
jgi:hypothetical protein